MLRAYVRTLCGGDVEAMRLFISSPLWSGLHIDPVVEARLTADSARWNADLAADGLDPDRLSLVMRAAEGYAGAFCYGDESLQSLERARAILLGLTLGDSPLPSV